MNCPICGSENDREAEYCGNCGNPLKIICAHCGNLIKPGLKFCTKCGSPISTHPLSREGDEHLLALRRAAPPELKEKIRTASLQDQELRKPVTILFTDIVGSTAMAEKLDPEEWKEIVSGAHQRVSQAVYRYEGTIAQLLGDGVLAFFGAPVTHEDDPIRAVLAALDIQASIAEYACELRNLVGSFQMRIGINTGLVVVANVGSDLHMEYLAIGDAVNLAARLQSAAQPGRVLISENTARLVQAAFELQPLGELSFKGKTEAIPVYQVQEPKAKLGRMRGLDAHGISSPLVGREGEFATLMGCIERLSSGRGGIVGIIGEAGLGKSRLMAEIHKAVAGSSPCPQIQWLEGRSLSFGQTISYWPFQEILRAWAQISEKDNESQAWNKLEDQVSSLFGGETIDFLPFLATLLALDVREPYTERVRYLDGDAMGKQIFLTTRRFFERLAHSQPLVLVFEDLHWIDESSAELVHHLLPLVESAPLLIIGISRPGREAVGARLRRLVAVDYADFYTEIRLSPLSEVESAQLVRNLLEIRRLPQHVSEMIISKAEGNPFFLEEVIRTLISAGVLLRDPAGGWRATRQIETFAIPDTIQGVIMARVDLLEEGVRQVLRVAAVIGRSFLYRVLQAIADAGQLLDEYLVELQQIELIREKQRLPEIEYIFKHALAQEATYESVLLQKRRELHARVGQAFETLFADRLEEFYSLLAYHFARAEDWEKAHGYLLKAGDQAGRISADAEALAHYQQAMVVYGRAFGEQWDPVQRASLESKMSEAFFRRGEFSQALEYARRALACLGYRLPESSWEMRLAIFHELAGQLLHYLLPRIFTKPAPQPVSQAFELETRLYNEITVMEGFHNPDLYFLMAFRLLNLSEQRGYAYGTAAGAVAVGTAFDFLGWLGLAERYHRRALAEAEKQANIVETIWAKGQLCYHGLCAGELDEGLELVRSVIPPHREIGEMRNVAMAIWMAAYNHAHRGETDRALAYGEDLVRLGQDSADHEVWCWGELVQGYALRREGRLDQAIAHQQKAIELSEAIPDYLTRVPAGAELGLCYLGQGDWQAAVKELKKSQQLSLEHNMNEPYGAAVVRTGLAEAYLTAVEKCQADERPVWLKDARQACKVTLRHTRVFRVKLPKAMRLQGRYEWLVGKPVAAQKWWQRSLEVAEKIGLRYDQGMTHLEIGRRLGDEEHLNQAKAIFTQLGVAEKLE